MGQLVRGAPGLYLRGLPSEPILPLSAVTAFVGIASRGPLHSPELIRSWDEFLIVFGDLVDYSVLPHEVFGFFRNGGRRSFVVRVADLTDYSNENARNRCPRVDLLKAASNAGTIADVNGAETIKLTAINEGRWGNDLTYEFRAASQRHMPLTTLAAAAPAGATTVTMAEPFDLVDGMSVRLAPPGDPFGGPVVTLSGVTSAADTVTIAPALASGLPLGTSVVGQGFKLVVRLGNRTEVFDNLSMSRANARYFPAIVNGPDESLSYVERQALGHSILVRVEHVRLLDRSLLRPVFQTAPAPFTGGGDGFRYSSARFKDAAGADSIRVTARASADKGTAMGTRGNTLRVRAKPFEMRTALLAAAGAQQVVLDDVTGLAVGDSLTLTSTTPAASETNPVTGVDPGTNIVVLNTGVGGLTNGFLPGSTASVANRITLAIYQDSVRPLTTTLASIAAAGVTQVVVDNVAGLHVGDTLTVSDPAGVAESRTIATVVGHAVTFAGGLATTYPAGSLVTVAGSAGRVVEPSEVHRNLSADPANAQYVRTRLAAKSTLLCSDADNLLPPPAGEVTLVGGRDPGEIDFRWYTGYNLDGSYFVPAPAPANRPAGERYGLAALETIDEVDLVTVPDLASQTLQPPPGSTAPDAMYLLPHRQVLHHASRLGDRMAILNTRLGVVTDLEKLPQLLADPKTGGYGALYYPWVTVAIGDDRRAIPASGLVAGAMARVDSQGGVGRAPANVALKDVVALERLLEQADQDDLNPAGVNAIRRFEAPALELWGARTLSSDPSSRYINVRRLIIAIKKAINRTLLWTVFEPNGPALRRKIQSSLEGLMQTLVAGGGTPGGRDAFFVKCDEENNPKAVSDLGQVIATIGVALVAPAEFIVLNVKRTPDAVSVTEEAV